jgi:type II secretory pathway pseudopilin PulG
MTESFMTNRASVPRETRRTERGEEGFTLVEALVAIVILVFGLIAITNLMLVAASSNSVANQATAAATIASQRLEQLKALPFLSAGLAPGGGVTSDVAGYFSSPDDAVPGAGVIHTRWQIVGTGNPDVIFIRVRSEGTGALSVGRSRAEFTTFRACTSTVLGCP